MMAKRMSHKRLRRVLRNWRNLCMAAVSVGVNLPAIAHAAAPPRVAPSLRKVVHTPAVHPNADVWGALVIAVAAYRRIARSTTPVEGGGEGTFSHFVRSAQVNAELARGITSDLDVMYNEATDQWQTREGSQEYLWRWAQYRMGSTRQLASTVLTATDWTSFEAHCETYRVGSGDYTIVLPATMTMPTGLSVWTPPEVTAGRHLYLAGANIPTANVMPTTADIHASSVIAGPAAQGMYGLIGKTNAAQSTISITGVEIQLNNAADRGIIYIDPETTPTTTADLPYGFLLDRVWVNGDNVNNARRGLQVNGQQIAMLESWITNVRMSGTEVSGIGGWNGCRYIFTRNCYIEAAGIISLIGGADPTAGNSGIFDPRDIFHLNTVGARKQAWIDALIPGMKNTIPETKNASRVTVANFYAHRSVNTGQSFVGILQNLSDGNTNLEENRVEDIVWVNTWANVMQSGITVASSVAYADGFCGTQVGNVLPLDAPGYSTILGVDGYADGLTLGLWDGYNITQTRIVTSYVGAGKVATLESPFDPPPTPGQAVRFLDPPLPVHPTNRVAILNTRLTGLGATANEGTTGRMLFLTDDIQNVVIDKISWTGPVTDSVVYPNMHDANNVILTNFAGPAGFGLGYGTVAAMKAQGTGIVWEGNAVFGGHPDAPATRMIPGATVYSDAAEMGFNTTTTVLTGPATTVGVNGGMPGCDNARIDAAFAPMASWMNAR